MSFIEVVEIEFTSKKSCFISIPKKWNFRSTNTIPIFKIKSLKTGDESKEVLMSWSGDTNDGQTIQMNGLFANKSGFSHKQQVLVSFVATPESEGIRNGIKCHLKPITENDWQILSINSSFVETNILNQIRVLVSGQIFPVWITNQSNVCLFVECFRLVPNKSKAIILNNLCEVVVCPPNSPVDDESPDDSSDSNQSFDSTKNQSIARKTDQNIDGDQRFLSSMFGFVKSFIAPNNPIEDNLNSTEIRKPLDKIELKINSTFDRVLRVLPFADETENNNKDLVNTVFISDKYFDDCKEKYFICKLTHILSPIQKKKENQKNEKKDDKTDEKDSNEEKSVSKLVSKLEFKDTVVVVCGHNQCPESSIFICDTLRRQMALKITSRVQLSQWTDCSVPLISELILCPIFSVKRTTISNDLIKSELIRLIEKTLTSVVLLSNGSLIHLCDLDFYTYNTNQTSIYGITKSSLMALMIDICEPVICIQKPFSENTLPIGCLKKLDKSLKSCLSSQFIDKPFAAFDEIFKKCLNFLRLNLRLDVLSTYLGTVSMVKSSSILIIGQKGSGKTHLINALINKLIDSPNFVFVQYIDCQPLKGKRIETLRKDWDNSLAECLHRQPSLLVFDNLDAIASIASKPGQELSAEAVYSERVALLFAQLIEKCNRKDLSFGDRIAVIATTRSKQSLQTALVQTRGRHVFNDMIEMPSPDLKQRMDIISKLISYRFGSENIDSHLNFNLKDIAIKCKGYSPLDMTALIDRALHNCYLISKTNILDDLVLTEDNFEAAFDGFSPLNLRGLQLELKSNRRLTDVGGLDQVKKTLLETILWSIKYPVLFSKLPLKAQSSIMLFGAPGTGKTLLIEAIANECGINFIGISGPELLSKYVGQSEQSVRDVFTRAQTAKPCILFFDEFDALAPRRGHDSTGVTDRVVNQLLTEMDGFEDMGSGVYVLSATSRPDLIDPALLRPGRFDKCLYCSLPNQKERLEILNALSTKLVLSPDIDFEMISRQTEYFSGADLQSLLYSAQLDALHIALNDSKNILNRQKNVSADLSQNPSLENLAKYMPSVEKGICYDLSSTQRQKLINGIEIYLPNAVINGNNISDVCSPESGSKRLSTNNLIAIQQINLLTALDITKPSISETERTKYDKIFQAFVSSGGQSFQSMSSLSKKKVTLA